MAHYLVTGVAGMIASRVAAMLLEGGHTVTGVDDLNDSYDVRVKSHRLERLQESSGFRFARLDIVDRASLELLDGLPDDMQAVIHLAARAGVRASVDDPWAFLDTNVTGTLNLLDYCRRRQIHKFVLASSSSVYSSRNAQPFSESALTDRPLSPYAASKKAAEVLAHTYHVLHGIDVTVFRYFTVYGPAGRPDMAVFRFIQRIREGREIEVYGDGSQSRDFTFVDDIARGTIAGLTPVGYEVINLGGDSPTVLLELVAEIENTVGRKARIRHRDRHLADVEATWADVAKARKLLHWQPAVSLHSGIELAVRWYEAEREWASSVVTR